MTKSPGVFCGVIALVLFAGVNFAHAQYESDTVIHDWTVMNGDQQYGIFECHYASANVTLTMICVGSTTYTSPVSAWQIVGCGVGALLLILVGIMLSLCLRPAGFRKMRTQS